MSGEARHTWAVVFGTVRVFRARSDDRQHTHLFDISPSSEYAAMDADSVDRVMARLAAAVCAHLDREARDHER